MKPGINFILSIFFISLYYKGSAQDLAYCKMEVKQKHEKVCRVYYHDKRIYTSGLDTLDQVKFWRSIINMSPDSGLINIASTRKVIAGFSDKNWESQTDLQKENYRDSVRNVYGLAPSEKILFSLGKNHFYGCASAVANIDKAIPIFEREQTDPFYAQAILLIESPTRCAKSNVGACGSFQIMKSVAQRLGLKVNRYKDERKDFNKAAIAAAKLIRTICIPNTNAILDKYNLTYSEDDLWYRLLVLHVYHAGSANVEKAIAAIHPTQGSIDLIKKLWNIKAGKFGNASQNYSQIALANLIELDNLVIENCDEINPVFDSRWTIISSQVF